MHYLLVPLHSHIDSNLTLYSNANIHEKCVPDYYYKQKTINQLRQELSAKENAAPNQETMDGIEMLEKHLIKLSERLRTKNQEVETLQAVIHRECVERGKLMDELTSLRNKSR